MDSLQVLKAERDQAEKRVKALNAAIRALTGATSGPVNRGGAKQGRKMSPATKAKIRASAKARWAKIKAKQAK